jgi:DNA-binding MarR family transcriptional regulator
LTDYLDVLILRTMDHGDHIDAVIAKWKRERPDYDLAPVEIIGRTGRIMEYVDRALEAKFDEFGISRAIFDVLATLKRNGSPFRMSQRELMRSLLRTSGSVSLRIDLLEKERLVTRTPDADDRRVVFVTLTAKGIDLLEEVIPEHLINEKSLLTGLSSAEREQLTGLLRKWLASLEAQTSDGPISQLGMTLLDPRISLMKRRAVGLPDVPGFLIHAVEPGSWSDTAGFRKGDLICKIEGKGISTPAQLRKALNAPRPRIKRFSIVRGSESLEL